VKRKRESEKYQFAGESVITKHTHTLSLSPRLWRRQCRARARMGGKLKVQATDNVVLCERESREEEKRRRREERERNARDITSFVPQQKE
jgi:hypothetical protein